MVIYLVDTNIIINHLRDDKEATNFLIGENVLLSYITKAELIRGVRNRHELNDLIKTIKDFDIDWGGDAVSKRAIEVLTAYQLKQGIGIMDAIIAATACVNNYVLVTANLRHFRGIEGLVVKKFSEVVKSGPTRIRT